MLLVFYNLCFNWKNVIFIINNSVLKTVLFCLSAYLLDLILFYDFVIYTLTELTDKVDIFIKLKLVLFYLEISVTTQLIVCI